MESLFGSGIERRINELREYIKANPKDHQAKLALMGTMLDDGRGKQAEKELKKLSTGDPQDADFHLYLAQYSWIHYQNGPGFSMSGEGVSYGPVRPNLNRKAWNNSKLKEIKKRLEKALKINPAHEPSIVLLGHVLVEQESYKNLFKLASNTEEVLPDFPWIPYFRAKAAQANGDTDEALKQIEDAMARAANQPAFLMYASELYEDTGITEKSVHLKKQSQFYSVVPPFIEWEYNESAYKSLDTLRLFPREEGSELSDEEREARYEKFGSEVTRLCSNDTQESNQALAILCVTHSAHGKWEDLAFETLEKRGQRGLLRNILMGARSNCTIASAGAALARLKDPSAFDILIQMLPNDTAPIFSAKVAYSLCLLGDMRASDPLINIAKTSDGYAREEAILALGAFTNLQDVQNTLNELTSDPELGVLADVSLYRFDKNTERLKRIEEAIKEEGFYGEYQILRYLELIDDSGARQLSEVIDAHLEMEREESKKEQEDRLKKLNEQSTASG